MKRLSFWAMALALGLCACNNSSKQQSAEGQPEKQPKQATAAGKESAALEDEAEFPPLMAFCVKGQPLLFVPFNDGDIPGGGKDLKSSPKTYTTYILGEEAFDVTFKEEKNKQLENDESCINQYLYMSEDKMKGMVYNYADAAAVDKYLNTHGDMLPEGEIVPMQFAEGLLVTPDYMKTHSLLKFMDTTTEDPEGPTFSENVIKRVEKLIGMKVENNRVATMLGGDVYEFGVMTTGKKDNYALGMYVLAKGNDVSLCVDTLRASEEDGNIDWSMADPDTYQEPNVIAVVKGEKGLEIFCSVPDAETTNFLWLRQEGTELKQRSLGSFFQHYD